MAAIDEITSLAQSIYLAGYGRYNDVEDEDLTEFLNMTIDWVNQYTQELELEADWNFLRTQENLIATISDITEQTYALPATERTAVINPYRDATLSFDGSVVATFEMVNPNMIADPTDRETHDRATVIGGNLILSRPLKDAELGAELRVDTIGKMPVLTMSDVTLLSTVKPLQLIVLGVAKNTTLPDVVQGGISPSLAQKYDDLLKKAVAQNNLTAGTLMSQGEDYSSVAGVW